MKSVLRILVYAPLGVVLLFFAMANRKLTPVWLDPFANAEAPGEPALQAPLFLIVFIAMAIGVLAGGLSSWLAHRTVRRAAKLARADAERARAEVEKLRLQALSSLPSAAESGRGR